MFREPEGNDMSNDLREQLADLATEAPAPAVGDAGALWAVGKRRHRRRTAAGVLAAAGLIAGVGSLGLALPGDAGTVDPSSVAPSGTSRLPDHLYAPSQWLDGTAEDGPIGPLALVIGGQFRHETDAPGLVGVSAVTGEYRFLDLPGRHETETAEVSEIALSADGSRVAYWYGGKDSKREFMTNADGVAVYDTVTGKVQRHPVDSPTTLLGESLLWVGDQLVLTAFDADAGSSNSANNGRTLVWTPKTDQLERRGDLLQADRLSVDGNSVVQGAGRTVRWIDPLGRTRGASISVLQDGAVYASPDGSQIATRRDPDDAATETGAAAPAVVGGPALTLADRGPLIPPRVWQLRDVPGPKVHEIEGWRDNQHIVVLPELKDDSPWQYASLDIQTGDLKPLVISGGNAGAGNYAFASEAWTWPSVPASEPDWPHDGRLLPGLLAAGAIVLGAGSFLFWRRSRVRG
jgi:hypothetical protein